MNITNGKIAKAQKVVIYGTEGIGKSSLAAKFPNPIFIDTEGSTSNMDVARFDKPTSWSMLMQQLQYVKQNKPCKTLVIDTIDWAERLCIEFVTSSANKKSITEFGYGEGFIKLEEEFGRFLNRLSDLVDIGINVILTAHAKIVKFEQPDEMGAYDRYELKLGNKTTAKTASLTKEWADMVLFCNYKTLSVATDDKGSKFKGQGGKRVIYTAHHPAWDAKNRFGLPNEIEMAFSAIEHIFVNSDDKTSPVKQEPTPVVPPVEPVQQPTTAESNQAEFSRQEPSYEGLPTALADLMKAHGVTTEEIQTAVSQKGYFPVDTPITNYDEAFINGVLIAAWEQVFQMIQKNRKF